MSSFDENVIFAFREYYNPMTSPEGFIRYFGLFPSYFGLLGITVASIRYGTNFTNILTCYFLLIGGNYLRLLCSPRRV